MCLGSCVGCWLLLDVCLVLFVSKETPMSMSRLVSMFLLGEPLGLVGFFWNLVITEAVSGVQDWILGLPEVFC